MMRMRLLIRIPVLICLVTAGCAEMMAPAGQPDAAAFDARKAKAEKLTRKGDLAEALVQWKVLETILGSDPELARKRRAVEANAKRQAERHYSTGRAALAKRRVKRARRQFLAALALDPRHEGAIEELRKIEVRRVRADRPAITSPMPRMPNRAKSPSAGTAESPAKAEAKTTARSKSAARPTSTAKSRSPAPRKPDLAPQKASRQTSESLERAVALAKQGDYLAAIPYYRNHLAKHPKDGDATKLLAVSHREVGISLYNRGKLRESLKHLEASVSYAGTNDTAVQSAVGDAKSRLAQQSYEKGVRVFRQDVARAIALWEEALSYDPSHAKAKSYLDRAYKIQQTLNALPQ
jgi:tetratricopeptide (TPR) repeat protein